MKIGVISPPVAAHMVDKAGWVADGFRQAGYDVDRGFTIDDVVRLDDSCDLLVFDHYDCALDVPRICRIAETRRAKWVQWWRDLVAFHPGKTITEELQDLGLLQWSRGFDLVLVKERGLLDQWSDAGVKAAWFDQACPADMPACRYAEKPEWGVLVIGCVDRPERRLDMIHMARGGLRVAWAGLPDPSGCPPGVLALGWTHPYRIPDLVSRAAVCLDVGQRVDVEGYASDRMYILGGCGACVVQRAVPGVTDIGQVLYSDASDVIESIVGLSEDLPERRRIGEATRKEVLANHTYASRAKAIAKMF